MFDFFYIKRDDQSKPSFSIFQIAATFIGTVIGAGFASGQEVLQFFGYYGVNGFLGVFVATLLFIIYGYIIIKLGWRLRAYSHLDILKGSLGKWLEKIIDTIIVFFLFGSFTTMIAGSGAIFEEQFAIHSFWGNFFMVLVSFITVILGIKGVISAVSFIVPILAGGVLIVALRTLIIKFPFDFQVLNSFNWQQAPISNWLLSAVIYVSYNIIIAIAVLAPLGGEIDDEPKIKFSSIIGGAGLGAGAGIILLTMLLYLPEVLEYEVPILYISGEISSSMKLFYSFILLAEIYTTAVGNLFGFVRRISEIVKINFNGIVVLASLVALLFSPIGFSKLVSILYPLVGYAGLVLLVGLTISFIKMEKKL